jgi:hypothetical protein
LPPARLVSGVFQVELRLEVLHIVDGIVLAGNDILESLAFLVTLEGRFVEFVVDGLVLLVVDDGVQNAFILDGLFQFVPLEEFFLWSGQVDLTLQFIFLLVVIVLREGFWLQIEKV